LREGNGGKEKSKITEGTVRVGKEKKDGVGKEGQRRKGRNEGKEKEGRKERRYINAYYSRIYGRKER
jgi:hypothetical protein